MGTIVATRPTLTVPLLGRAVLAQYQAVRSEGRVDKTRKNRRRGCRSEGKLKKCNEQFQNDMTDGWIYSLHISLCFLFQWCFVASLFDVAQHIYVSVCDNVFSTYVSVCDTVFYFNGFQSYVFWCARFCCCLSIYYNYFYLVHMSLVYVFPGFLFLPLPVCCDPVLLVTNGLGYGDHST